MSIILWSAFCVIISRVKEKSRVIFCRIVAKSIDRIDFLGMSIFLFSFCIKNVLKKKTTNKQNKQNRLRNQNREKKRTSPPKKKTKNKNQQKPMERSSITTSITRPMAISTMRLSERRYCQSDVECKSISIDAETAPIWLSSFLDQIKKETWIESFDPRRSLRPCADVIDR